MDYERYYMERDLEEVERCIAINAKIRKCLKEIQGYISELPPDADMIYGLESKMQLEALMRANLHIDYRYTCEELRIKGILHTDE